MDYNVNIKKEEYERLLKFVDFLKNNLQDRINDIEEIYNLMNDYCSLDGESFYSQSLIDCKNSINEIIEKINGSISTEIDEKLIQLNNMNY